MISCIGIGHIFMPSLGYEPEVPAGMTTVVRDHFYYLGTYAICLFLLAQGFVSIYASRVQHRDVSIVICTVFAIVWIGRMILEVIYPVRLRLFFLADPTAVLFPVICVIAFTYTIGSIAFFIQKRKPEHAEQK